MDKHPLNEYARLAKAKPLEARTTAELLAAVYAFDQADALAWAVKVEALEPSKIAGALPARYVNSAALIELVDELRARKNPQVSDGRPVLRSVNDVSGQCLDIRDKKKEYLIAFFLNARHQLVAKEIISIGTLTASLAHPREIFAPAIGQAAAAVILVHNHPSGDPSPSDEDVRLTTRIAQAGHILGIELLDHMIIAVTGCYSFKTAGRL